MSDPDLVVGIDPGGTTGLAWWYSSNTSPVSGLAQIGACQTNIGLRELLRQLGRLTTFAFKNVVLAYESFEFRHDERDRDKIDYTAAEVIGALRVFALDQSRVRLVAQNAATAKGFWTDDKLKRLAVWVPGNKHAMDATRHLLRYRTFVLNHQYLLRPLKKVSE